MSFVPGLLDFKLIIITCIFLILDFIIFRRKIYDEYNDEVVELTKEEIKVIRRLVKGKAPHLDFDPYPVCTYQPFFSLLFILMLITPFLLYKNVYH